MATSLYKLVLSCIKVVGGGYKFVQATTSIQVSHPRLGHGCEFQMEYMFNILFPKFFSCLLFVVQI